MTEQNNHPENTVDVPTEPVSENTQPAENIPAETTEVTSEISPEPADEPTESPAEATEESSSEEAEEYSLLNRALADDLSTANKKSQKQVLERGINWYVIQTYTGYEEAVKKALMQRIESYNMQDQIFEVLVPKETTVDYSKTKPEESKEVKKRIFPGYVFVNMKVTDESWYIVRNTPHVTGFLGAGTVPVPVDPVEYQRIKAKIGVVDTKHKVDFKIGDIVMIKEGPFAKFEGEVKDIDQEKRKIKVTVNVFGRETPLEMDLYQVIAIT
jgi:transcriptional antiterminator NusG